MSDETGAKARANFKQNISRQTTDRWTACEPLPAPAAFLTRDEYLDMINTTAFGCRSVLIAAHKVCGIELTEDRMRVLDRVVANAVDSGLRVAIESRCAVAREVLALEKRSQELRDLHMFPRDIPLQPPPKFDLKRSAGNTLEDLLREDDDEDDDSPPRKPKKAGKPAVLMDVCEDDDDEDDEDDEDD